VSIFGQCQFSGSVNFRAVSIFGQCQFSGSVMWTFELVVMLVMIAFNGVFASYEIALASVGVARLDSLARDNHAGAAAALRMRTNMEGSLAVVQLGITLVGAVAAATGGAGAEEMIQPWLMQLGFSEPMAQVVAISFVVIPLIMVTIVFGELMPKVFALQNKEWVCLRLSPMIEWFGLCAWPIVWLLENSVSWLMLLGRPFTGGSSAESPQAMQELWASAALARTARLIGRREEAIIIGASRMSTTAIGRIMLPADHICMLSIEDSFSSALLSAHANMHTRFPVTSERGNPQAIIGYVNFKDIVAALRLSPQGPSIRKIMRPLPAFRDNMTIAACLEAMIRDHNHIALVRDPRNAVVGLITMEDILEELVGEIHDEYDRLPSHIVTSGDGWIVGGNISLVTLQRATSLELPSVPERVVNTLNEWVMAHLGRPVHQGEEILVDNFRVLVRKVRRQFVMEALISPQGTSTVRGEPPNIVEVASELGADGVPASVPVDDPLGASIGSKVPRDDTRVSQ